MKKALLIFSIITTGFTAHAQKLELSVQANSGLFHYTGLSAESHSFFIQGSSQDLNYTNNPYGKNYAYSYGAGLKANWVANSGFIFGIQAGYEILRSKTTLTAFSPYYDPNTIHLDALYTGPYTSSGNTILTSNFININPYVGYRFKFKKVSLDVLPGMDIGVGLSSKEKGNVYLTSTDQSFTSDRKRQKPPVDTRARLSTSVNYQRFSINLSYARGFSNYTANMIGSNPKVYSELFRLGAGYRLY